MPSACCICAYLRTLPALRTMDLDQAIIAIACAAIGTVERYGTPRVIAGLCEAHRSALSQVQENAATVLDRKKKPDA